MHVLMQFTRTCDQLNRQLLKIVVAFTGEVWSTAVFGRTGMRISSLCLGAGRSGYLLQQSLTRRGVSCPVW